MTTDAIIKGLHELSQGAKRSNTAKLRSIYPAVEAAIKSGVRTDDILATLQANGISFTPKSFASALYRIRKKQAEKPFDNSDPLPIPSGPEISAPQELVTGQSNGEPEVTETPADESSEFQSPRVQREKKALQYVNKTAGSSIFGKFNQKSR